MPVIPGVSTLKHSKTVDKILKIPAYLFVRALLVLYIGAASSVCLFPNRERRENSEVSK
tara:strand:- start:2282 stop:2458 length:177 start_codon:yes stop_codon:yes gene_type:complete